MPKIYLSEKQYRMAKMLCKSPRLLVDDLASALSTDPASIMRDLAELVNRGLVSIDRKTKEYYRLTKEAEEYLVEKLPEERVYGSMYRCLNQAVNDFLECIEHETGLTKNKVGIGFQYLVRERCIEVTRGRVVLGLEENCLHVLEKASWIKASLRAIQRGEPVDPKTINVLKRRKLITSEKKTEVIVKALPALHELWERGDIERKELVTVVKPSMAEELDKYVIKEFDLSVSPPRVRGAKVNSYIEFLDMIRELLVAMGFEEVKGPHVELEFWNFDALFQAQDHPAREIHDTFFVDTEFHGTIPVELLEKAGKVHERGWGYKWNPLRSLRPILRTQTTAVSVRAIFERGSGEYRVFSLDRVFRPETLDAKHAMEFYQLDGIIVGRNVNFKHLLAFFKEFAAALGIKQVWFKPGYFPFTEPSVEGFVKHPRLGWIEVFPGGVFRPEVMEILGAKDVRAIAWGIGIDRLAMTILGLDDIRDLFSQDLDLLRKLPLPRLPCFFSKTSGQDVEVVSTPL